MSRHRQALPPSSITARIFILLVTVLGILSAGPAVQAQNGSGDAPPVTEALPEVAFGTEGITISSVTLGGAVAVLSVTRQVNSSGATDVVIHDALVPDDDEDGVVFWQPAEIALPPPPLSVWLVVDVASGATVMAWPGGFEPTEVDAELTEEPGDSAPGRVRMPLRRAELLWVRPAAEGPARVLRASLGDGASEDGDGARDGGVAVAPPVFARTVVGPGQAGPPAEPPGRFEPGDLLLAVDAGSLRAATLRLPGPSENPGGGGTGGSSGNGNGNGTGGEG